MFTTENAFMILSLNLKSFVRIRKFGSCSTPEPDPNGHENQDPDLSNFGSDPHQCMDVQLLVGSKFAEVLYIFKKNSQGLQI